MLEDQFYMRLLLQMAAGVVYIFAYLNMAKRNSMEVVPKRHLALKIIGSVWAVLGIIMGIAGIYAATRITFPQSSIEPPITANMIVRTSDKYMYWGYATMEQSQTISLISGVFEMFALSAYCFMFKASKSKWYTKIGKFIFCIFFYGLYASATNFHYFDTYEWTAPVLFAIMAFFALRNNGNKLIENFTNMEDYKTNEEFVEGNIENNSRFMPHAMLDSTAEQSVKEEPEASNLRCDATCETKSNEDALSNKQKCDKDSDPGIVSIEQTIKKAFLSKENEHSSVLVEDTICAGELKNIDNENSDDQVKTGKVNTETISSIKFCRHCGGKIDYASDKFCKHCGKKLY